MLKELHSVWTKKEDKIDKKKENREMKSKRKEKWLLSSSIVRDKCLQLSDLLTAI